MSLALIDADDTLDLSDSPLAARSNDDDGPAEAIGPVLHDARGCAVSGADPSALALFERALAAYAAWRGGADELLARALRTAPHFVMAHVLQAWMLVTGRDPRRVRLAREPLAQAREACSIRPRAACSIRPRPARSIHSSAAHSPLPREALHLEALEATLADDYPRAKALLSQLLHRWPRDVLALQVAHSLDYLTGDLGHLAGRPAEVLPAWHASLPGFHAVRAMQAFGLVEGGHVAAAEQAAHAALARNPLDARAHHALAHVYDCTGRAAEGARWLEQHAGAWATSRMVATHCAWHLALFHLDLGDVDRALALHDRHIPAARTGDIADLVDASALLWRLHLQGIDVGGRWQPLARAWAPHIDDGFCSFSDVHAMLAFVGAGDQARADRLVRSLQAAAARPTRHGATTRRVGLPACRALAAFGRGEPLRAIEGLAAIPAEAHRLGGSHAQRDVLHLTLLEAVQRIRRPAPQRPPQDSGSQISVRSAAGATSSGRSILSSIGGA